MDFIKKNKFVLAGIILVLLLLSFKKESFENGPTNFSQTTYSKVIPLNYGPDIPPPTGDYKVPTGFNDPPNCGKKECPSSRRSNYDYPNTTMEPDSPYGSIGPFYKSPDGTTIENPDVEQLKYLDLVHNVLPSAPLAKQSIAKLESKGSPYAGPPIGQMSVPSKFFPLSQPNGLRDEIRYGELYALDNNRNGNSFYSGNNVMRLGDHILNQPATPVPPEKMYMYPPVAMSG